ncbi:MAG TPA: hypothetical protein VGB95_03705 [Chitinophagales bacterium]
METQHIQSDNERKAGEMFTASILKRVTPLNQFLFAAGASFLVMLLGKFVLDSKELVKYAGCFGVVFFVMFNPWLSLLRDDSKRYFLQSVLLYITIVALLYGLIFLWTGATLNDLEVKLTLITTSFYTIVAYAMMSGIKFLFIDNSGGGL